MNSVAVFVALVIAVFMATFVPSAAAFDAGDGIMLAVGLVALFIVIFAILGCISRRGQASA